MPKMRSMKSRLATRAPGTKNRVSIARAGVKPGTAGHTTGRRCSETKHSAGAVAPDVKGKRSSSGVGRRAARSRRAKTAGGTAFLSSGTGTPRSAT